MKITKNIFLLLVIFYFSFSCIKVHKTSNSNLNRGILTLLWLTRKPVCTVSTFAGSGSYGHTDGTGTAASFGYPYGVTVDSNGNVYVADPDRIRKISSLGVVTTLAGSGNNGSNDGAGTAASFNNPHGVAVDTSGNIYVADTANNKIRKITSTGNVTTLAGSGSSGSTDGAGTVANFNMPSGVAVDISGNVYVTDTYSYKIRKITGDGIVTTLAGSGSYGYTDGTGIAASFRYPYGVTVDNNGNVYVADYESYRIRKITSTGIVTTIAGPDFIGSGFRSGTIGGTLWPLGVTVDSNGNVYATDETHNSIEKITPSGEFTILAGKYNASSGDKKGSIDGIGTAASFNYPSGIAIDNSGNIFIADTNNNKIRKMVCQ